MKRFALLGCFCAIGGIATAAAVGPTIDVFTALAPNVFGSPSYPTWETNAVEAMKQGLTSNGTPGTPTYFQTVNGPIDPSLLSVTSFPSWLGTADPATAFGPAFANELGNRGAFPLLINGHGIQFSISQLSFVATSSDAGNVLGFSFGAGSYNYNSGYVGILFGGNGVLGGGDDTYITSGLNTQLVDGLAGRGSGNALWPCGPGDLSPCGTTAEQQAAIDSLTAVLEGKTFTGQYFLPGTQGSAAFSMSSVPEPASLSLIGLGAGALVVFRKRMVKV